MAIIRVSENSRKYSLACHRIVDAWPVSIMPFMEPNIETRIKREIAVVALGPRKSDIG